MATNDDVSREPIVLSAAIGPDEPYPEGDMGQLRLPAPDLLQRYMAVQDIESYHQALMAVTVDAVAIFERTLDGFGVDGGSEMAMQIERVLEQTYRLDPIVLARLYVSLMFDGVVADRAERGTA